MIQKTLTNRNQPSPREAELPAEEDAEDADAEPKEAELPAEEDAEVAPEAE